MRCENLPMQISARNIKYKNANFGFPSSLYPQAAKFSSHLCRQIRITKRATTWPPSNIHSADSAEIQANFTDISRI